MDVTFVVVVWWVAATMQKNTLDKNYLYFAEKLGQNYSGDKGTEKLIPLSEDGGKV